MIEKLMAAASILELIAKDIRKAAQSLQEWTSYGLTIEQELGEALYAEPKRKKNTNKIPSRRPEKPVVRTSGARSRGSTDRREHRL